MDLLSFEDAYCDAQSKRKKISVLLGNGFSMAYNPDRFSFTNLLQVARTEGIIDVDSKLSKLFDSLKTSDFEFVIKNLEAALLVNKKYFPEVDLSNLQNDIKALKKHLVNTITNNHPENVGEIMNVESSICAKFLKKFEKIYTLNYDLLLYWVVLKEGLENIFSDGFGGGYIKDEFGEDYEEDFVKFKEYTSNILFLHGALHLFDNKVDTIKLTYSRTRKSLKEQIYRRLLKGIYPVFISEGTSDAKKEKIRHNYYLNHCFKSLRNQTGSLFVYGTNLKSNDEHILNQILTGKFDNLYIGVYSENSLDHAKMIKECFESKKGRTAILYVKIDKPLEVE